MEKAGYGGNRKGSGRPVDVVANLILYDVAIQLCLGRVHARRKIRELGAEACIGAGRVKNLMEWGSGKDGKAYLEVHRASYVEMRRRWGFAG